MAREGTVGNGQVEEQVAALPLRMGAEGRPEVLLVTSRGTGRWVLPKGNLMKRLSRAEAAALEAHEEGGVAGRVQSTPYRSFDYWKRRTDAFYFCRVDVFLLIVTREDESWKEDAERRRAWVSPGRAREMVLEPGLQSIFRELAEDDAIVKLFRPKADRCGWSEPQRTPSAAG